MKQLYKFSAVWCQPCHIMSKMIEDLKREEPELMSQIQIKEIDIDNSSFVNLVSQYNIKAIPTLVLIDSNGNTKRTTGSMQKQQLINFLK